MSISETEISDRALIEQYLTHEKADASRWYASGGSTNEEGEHHHDLCSKRRSELFAEAILQPENFQKLKSIEVNKRESLYLQESHNGETKLSAKESNREEDHISLALFRMSKNDHKTFDQIGKIVDYQTPLKNALSDNGIGKIDLMSYNDSEKTLYLLELKRAKNTERLLRAVLEIYTYSKLLAQEKLKEELSGRGIVVGQIKPAVLLFEGSLLYNEYVNNESPNTIELMKKLDVGFYGIRETGDGYEVFIRKLKISPPAGAACGFIFLRTD